MAEKKSFLNWVGFTGEDESSNQPSSVDRIRELEAQIADLKSRRESERIITEATTEVSGYRQWLAGVISEAERLYRIQKQSLDAAESAIQQSRNRLDGAFQRLEELQKNVLDNLNADDTLINPGPLKVSSQRTRPALDAPKKRAKPTAKKAAKKAPAKKSAATKTAKR
jgi:DNA repair exonuclease SbcCD ATPase subunit